MSLDTGGREWRREQFLFSQYLSHHIHESTAPRYNKAIIELLRICYESKELFNVPFSPHTVSAGSLQLIIEVFNSLARSLGFCGSLPGSMGLFWKQKYTLDIFVLQMYFFEILWDYTLYYALYIVQTFLNAIFSLSLPKLYLQISRKSSFSPKYKNLAREGTQ